MLVVAVLPESGQTQAKENSHQQGETHHYIGVPAGESNDIGQGHLVNLLGFIAVTYVYFMIFSHYGGMLYQQTYIY